ncbi:MAG TPA: GLUG motif-containing protein [archaeon]|nr:GLUG motif-containing protein [archaeon]
MKLKALSPIIATILLVVVAVILITIILTWGKEFSTSSLNKTNNFGDLKASDATNFIYPKSAQNGIMQFTYSPPSQITEDINITHYRVLNITEMTEPIALEEPTILTNTNILELPCLYEYSTITPDLTIQLITAENTYINIKTKDPGMVCSPGGTGTEADPIIICDAEDLNNIRNDLDANYSLGKDIDLQCFSRRDENGWEPIGNTGSGNYFTGSLNGNNHIINNLYINRPATDIVGLFGIINGELDNIGLTDVNITGGHITAGLVGDYETSGTLILNNSYVTGNISGNYIVGGLVGYNEAYIDNCYFSGNIIDTNAVGYCIGGLIGMQNWTNISNSYSTGTITVTSPSSQTGGLVGYADGNISNCYSTANVIGQDYVGGLVGYYYFNTISSSYATGDVNGKKYVGGFAGYNDGSDSAAGTLNISNSYSLGDVTRISGLDQNIGGFVGFNKKGAIINSYSTGSVSGNSWTPTDKGFVGAITTGGNYADTNNFYDTTISLQTSTAGNAVAKTTAQMKTQSTFSGWDFSTVWNITEGVTYPFLR